MFEQSIYQMVDQNNGKEIKQVLDTENNKVIWERAIPTTATPIYPTRTTSLISLVRKGKLIQEGTPTPDSPIYPSCNNGVLKYGVLGKNLFDINTVGIEQGAIASADGGNSNSTYRVRTAGYVPVKPSTQYTLSAVIDGYTSGSSRGVFVLEYSTNAVAGYTGDSSGWKAPDGYTFTTGATTNYIRIVFAAGSNSSAPVTPTDVSNVQLELGDTATDYEPYKGVGIYPDGTPEVLTVGGVNLCNPALYTGEGWYVGANNTVANANANGTLLFPCKPNTTYSWWHTSGAGGCRAFELPTDTVTQGQEASWAVGSPAYIDANVVKKYTTSAEAKLLCVLFARVVDQVGRTVDEQLADFMLVEGDVSTATDYQPYITPQAATVPNLFAVDDYADEVEIIAGLKNREIGIKVFDGTETIGTSNTCFTIGINDRMPTRTALLCSHFPYSSKTSSQTDDETIISFSSSNIGFRYDACADKTAFAAFLVAQYAAGTPVTLWYVLATAEETQTTPQPLIGRKNSTNIITSNFAPNTSEYFGDISYYGLE